MKKSRYNVYHFNRWFRAGKRDAEGRELRKRHAARIRALRKNKYNYVGFNHNWG